MQRFLGVYPQAKQAVINKCPQVVVMCKTCQYMLWIKGKTVENNPQAVKKRSRIHFCEKIFFHGLFCI